jgi:hypothetical protein
VHGQTRGCLEQAYLVDPVAAIFEVLFRYVHGQTRGCLEQAYLVDPVAGPILTLRAPAVGAGVLPI